MSRMNWKSLLAHEGDVLLTWLHDVEHSLWRMLTGIWAFIRRRIPQFFRSLLDWLNSKAIYAFRVTIRLARIVSIAGAWLAILIAPLAIFPGLLTGAWCIVAVWGSVWGLRRQLKNQNTVQITRKDGPCATA